jgi:hypothetical protein
VISARSAKKKFPRGTSRIPWQGTDDRIHDHAMNERFRNRATNPPSLGKSRRSRKHRSNLVVISVVRHEADATKALCLVCQPTFVGNAFPLITCQQKYKQARCRRGRGCSILVECAILQTGWLTLGVQSMQMVGVACRILVAVPTLQLLGTTVISKPPGMSGGNQLLCYFISCHRAS